MATIKVQNKDGSWSYLKTIAESVNSHKHTNKDTLDKFAETVDGLNFNNVKIALDSEVKAVSSVANNANTVAMEMTGHLNTRLAQYCQQIDDWDKAKVNGFYMGINCLNAPNSEWWMGVVVCHNDIWTEQIVSAFSTNKDLYRRNQMNGVWGSWEKITLGDLNLLDFGTKTNFVSSLNELNSEIVSLKSNSGGDFVKIDGTTPLDYITIGNRKTGSVTGTKSFAQGYNVEASGNFSHAQGYQTTASGSYSHAEGYFTSASGNYSHAEGGSTKTSGDYSHAQGYQTRTSGSYSHAEGYFTSASENSSHAEGYQTTASGNFSHAQNFYTEAKNHSSHAQGIYSNMTLASATTYYVTADAFVIGNGTSNTARSNAFRVTFDGRTYGKSAFNSTGADYAEYFEWLDGNLDGEDRVGYFVTIDGEKIRKANSNDNYILGIISANPSVIGDSHQEEWYDKYERDKWGRIQYHYVDVEYEEEIIEYVEDIQDENDIDKLIPITKTIKTIKQEYHPKLNPNWNNDNEYIPREKRKEWSAVGMMGKLLVRDDGSCIINGYCKPNDEGIATKSDNGYRVMKRIDEDVVQVLVI